METSVYEPKHFSDCVNLFVKVFNCPPWNDQWSTEKASEKLSNLSHAPDFKGFIGHVNGKIIGACFGFKKIWWNRDEFHIEEMFIDQECQRSGFGSKLLNDIKEILIRDEIKVISLITGRAVFAKDFYQKNGFNISENIVYMKKWIG